MKNFLNGLMLLVVVLLLSYFTAEYFGALYDSFSEQYDNTLGVGKRMLVFIVGLPFAFVFFTTFIFQVFGGENRNKWTLWLLIPALLFFGSGDLRHIYLPIILGLLALGLAKVVNKIRSR